jgi:DNA gyrase subunit A
MSRTARGKSAVNILDLDDGEEIESVVNTEDLDDDEFLTMVTRDGYIKRTAVEEFGNIRSTGIRAIRLEDGDELVDVEVTDGERDIVIGSRDGMAIRFDESDARAMGRTARGVIAIDLREGDAVAGVAAIDDGYHNWVLTVTENGYGKRSDLDEYRPQSRNGKGLVDIKTGDRNGEVVAIEAVTHGDHLIAMSAAGQIMRTRVEEISTVSRNTKGVIVMNLDPDDEVASVDIVPESVHAAADDEGDDDAETDDE